MDADTLARGSGAEPTPYDKSRHESMVLRDNGMYGKLKFFISGTAPSPWCPGGCGFRRVWCACDKQSG